MSGLTNVSNGQQHINVNHINRSTPRQISNGTSLHNYSNMKLDKLLLSDVVGEAINQSSKLEVTVLKDESLGKSESDYDDYFSSFVEDLEGVSEEEKDQLSGLIKKAITRNEDFWSSGWTSSKESMYHLQTKEKLHLIAEKVLPPSFAGEMKNVSNQFTDDQLGQTVDKSLQTYELIYNRDKSKAGPLGDIADRLKTSIQHIQEGNHIVQVEQKQYSKLFSELKLSDQFQYRYEEVMNGFKEIQKEQLGGSWDNRSEASLNESIQLLREDWNEFTNQFEEFKDYRVSSIHNSHVDIKI
ncbi:hypothetical protein [Sediminibacillus halophilus]|uniref:Uncharacterized protein n=1 Tax=Sediminibacillus halophilus TaxID=482461 RepID=A0A1G9VFQ0_9BACI|nr:hypothetical protein [Sediminibacillus halophilus]SDM70936.1 hypothetical protein SAMN05216244_3264 [Sediminibacillus halophilus]